MRFFLIANPVAGRGKARARTRAFLEELRRSGIRPVLKWTEAPGHARELGAQQHGDFDAILAVGGDGTAHEVAAGIIESKARIPLGVVPFGSGNDFARLLGMPKDIRLIVQSLAQVREANFDYGTVEWQAAAAAGRDIFVNAVGCGFDAFVADEVKYATFLKGHLRYLATVMRSLGRWQNPVAHVDSGVDGEARRWKGPLLLCTAAIGISSGGGFLLTPRATPTDALFDVCIARSMPLRRILQVLPLALAGRHIGAPEVSYFRAGSISLACPAGVPIHLDGEVIPHKVLELTARIVPGGLRVLTGQTA